VRQGKKREMNGMMGAFPGISPSPVESLMAEEPREHYYIQDYFPNKEHSDGFPKRVRGKE